MCREDLRAQITEHFITQPRYTYRFLQKNGVKYVLIEYCTSSDSSLCDSQLAGRTAICVRCTKEHDMLQKSSVDALKSFIRSIPKGISIVLWAGIPCTGGSTAQNGNSRKTGHCERIRKHYLLWHSLFINFLDLSSFVLRRGGHLVIEWPTSCRYWHEPLTLRVLAIPIWHQVNLTGCAYGLQVLSGVHEGKFLAKPWRFMTTMQNMSAHIGFTCPGGSMHVHAKAHSYTSVAGGLGEPHAHPCSIPHGCPFSMKWVDPDPLQHKMGGSRSPSA